ncbi:MAG: hypothetical protein LUC96_01240 [Alistipes sp.]|uniref:hypothetical protein n=1 Tax=Alistipes sp. TaxID=1872444 RepID=UPI0025C16890|nr:hypothetical protein [Alistipes sp.]MCD8273605.1 hypothetical protein [Alistipes sp.]
MPKYKYFQDEKTMVWQRHAFTVVAESEAEADRIIRENELNQTCVTDVDDTRIIFENTETLFETQNRIEPDENGGRHTLEVLTADKRRSVCTNADDRLSEGSELSCTEPAEKKTLSPQEQVKSITDKLIADLCRITEQPDDWLPHTVYVEEEGEDASCFGMPVYTMYKLEDYKADGSCTLYNPQTNERRSGHLYEINIDWLITVWNRYRELCVEQGLWREQAIHLLEQETDASLPDILEFVGDHWQNLASDEENIAAFRQWTGKHTAGRGQTAPEKRLMAFVWPFQLLPRNATDEQIITTYEQGPSRSIDDADDKTLYEVEKLTPDELAAEINDNNCAFGQYYVRFIEIE